jgi:hypothetical protein
MTTLTTDISYGMFSEVGNLAVHGVVVTAITMNLTWPQTYKCLNMLAKSDYSKFGEAMDKLDLHPMAWFDAGQNAFSCQSGNFFD